MKYSLLLLISLPMTVLALDPDTRSKCTNEAYTILEGDGTFKKIREEYDRKKDQNWSNANIAGAKVVNISEKNNSLINAREDKITKVVDQFVEKCLSRVAQSAPVTAEDLSMDVRAPASAVNPAAAVVPGSAAP